MAENIISCYSGSGRCLNIAGSTAKALGDTDIWLMPHGQHIPPTSRKTAQERID